MTFEDIVLLIEQGRVANLEAKVKRLQAALDVATDFLEDRCDVVDGDYGEPAPNREMATLTAMKIALGELP